MMKMEVASLFLALDLFTLLLLLLPFARHFFQGAHYCRLVLFKGKNMVACLGHNWSIFWLFLGIFIVFFYLFFLVFLEFFILN